MLRAVKLAGILGALGCLVAVEPVWADCVEGVPGARLPVSCTGTDDVDGYAATVNDVDVTVDAGATVDNGGASETILLLDTSTVTNDGIITATGDDTQGIEAGNDTTIDNQGAGEIHGGSGTDGIAVLFSGTDGSANNVLNNSGAGVIDTGGTIAVQGSVGNETVTLSDTSTLMGNINLGAGNDAITIEDDATATGSVDLGDGTNTFDITGTADLTGAITGGAGDDTVTITDTATVGGNTNLGDGTNAFTISASASYTATVTGGANSDTVTITDDATLTGDVELGAGDDTLTIDGMADYDGTINAGAGNDDVSLTGPDATLTGTVNLGDGTDSFTLDGAMTGANVTGGAGSNTIVIRGASNFSGTYTGGADADSITISDGAMASGDIILGAGSNSVTIQDTASFTASITGGAEDDTVTITDDATLTGNVDLGAGDDTFTIDGTADYDGTITAGAGNDDVTLTGPTATLTGTVNLGDGTDSFTLDGAMTGANVTGGAGSNTIVIRGASNFSGTYTGGAEVDTITIRDTAISSGVINLGDGSNSFTIQDTASHSASITGGIDDDTVTITGDATVTGIINLGAGDDILDINGNANVTQDVTAGAGNDAISLTGSTALLTGNINLGGDNDSFTLDGATYGGTVIAGVGDNTFTILGASNFSGTYTGDDGGDSVTVSSDATVSGTFDLGSGANSLTLAGGATGNLFTGSITGGAGVDQITLGDAAILGAAVMSTSEIDLGAGNDRIDIGHDSTVNADVDLGGGSDFIRIQQPNIMGGNTTFTGRIDLGDDEDILGDTNTVTIADAATVNGDIVGGLGDDDVTVQLGAVVNGAITLGDGENDVAIQQNAMVSGAITLGAGADLVRIGGGASVSAISLGDGENTLRTFNAADPMTRTNITGAIMGGADVDTVTIDGQATVGGSISLMGGADVFELIGGGRVTGTIELGDDDDIFRYDDLGIPGATGMITLGAGNDTFELMPGSTLPGLMALPAGDGDDTLQLGGNGLGLLGEFDIPSDIQFENLLIGPDAASNAFIWLLSTTEGRVSFDDIELQSGALVPNGTVLLDGNFTHRRAATASSQAAKLAFDLFPGPSNPGNSKLDIDGVLTLEGPDDLGNMDPADDLEGAASEVAFKSNIVEGVYTLITARNGIVGEFDVEVIPSSFAFAFSTEIVAIGAMQEDYVLTILRERFYDEAAGSASEANAGNYLEDARRGGGTGPFSAITNALDLLDADELKTALIQTNPEVYDAHTSSILSWGRVQQRILQQRSMRCDRFTYAPRPEVVSNSPCGSSGFMPWAKAVGDFSDHKGSDSSGYETLGGGVLLGFDHRFDEQLWLSADIGFGRVDIEHDNGADAEFDTIDLGVAAGSELAGITTRGSLTYSHGFHETIRTIDFVNDRTRSKHDSDRVSLAMGAGYPLRAGPFVFEPNAMLDYTHVTEESAKESGNDLLGLDVSSRKTDVFSATGGIRVATNFLKYAYVGDWLEWADGVWSPSVSVQWRQGFGDVDRDPKATMQGAPGGIGSFKSEAKDSNGGVELGGRVSFQPMRSSASVEVGYDGYFGDDVTNHSANVSVRVPF